MNRAKNEEGNRVLSEENLEKTHQALRMIASAAAISIAKAEDIEEEKNGSY